jgi:hypothetical protein
MKVVARCLVFVVAAFSAVGWAAQGKPNLSGMWISVGPQQEIRELSVKHHGSTLSLDGGPDHKATFKTDGSETKMSVPDGKSLLVKAFWEDNTLVVTLQDPETKQDIRRQTWAIDGNRQLVIGTEFLGPAAATMSGGKPRAPVKEIFKRR